MLLLIEDCRNIPTGPSLPRQRRAVHSATALISRFDLFRQGGEGHVGARRLIEWADSRLLANKRGGVSILVPFYLYTSGWLASAPQLQVSQGLESSGLGG